MAKPYSLIAKFSGTCARCRKPVSAGERIVRNPDGGKIFCTKSDSCGPQIMRATGQADLLGPVRARYVPGGA